MSVSVTFGRTRHVSSLEHDPETDEWHYAGRTFKSFDEAYMAREDDYEWGDAYAADDELDRRRDEE
jgi:hypothetical protein